MQESSEYTVKRKDTYVSIAKQIGLKDPMKLKEYHNERADFNSQVGNELHPNITLLIPSSEEIRNKTRTTRGRTKAARRKRKRSCC